MGPRASSRERTFREIYETHGPAVHAYLARRVGAAHVDDLAADTFMVAWRKLPRDVDEPLPWLFAVARREVANHRRKLAGGNRLVERLAGLSPRHESPGLPIVEPGLEPPLAAAFARLTDIEKEALLLVAWEHLDHAQAGRVVGCTAATFAVRVSRARGKLREALTPNREDQPLGASSPRERTA
jgi:RNA polymerase sigma factor (sigma-70 family)